MDDRTSLTLGEEKKKKKQIAAKLKLTKQQKKQHHNKYLVPMERVDYAKVIEDQGYNIVFNPPGDGSCQFAALASQLSGLGIFRSPETMSRRRNYRIIEENYLDDKGFTLLQFIPEFGSWKAYLQHMAKSDTINAAATLYDVNIHVVYTLVPGTYISACFK